MLTDLDNVILELNETLIASKVVQTKIAVEIQKQVHGVENQVQIAEAVVRTEGEKWMLELKTYSASGFGRFRSMFEANMTLEEWFEQSAWLRGQQDKLIGKLMEKVCEQPTALLTAFELAQQYGAHYLDNVFDVINVMATVVRSAPPRTKYYIHSGPMGAVYILVPKPGWSFSTGNPSLWKFTDENPAPVKYDLPKDS